MPARTLQGWSRSVEAAVGRVVTGRSRFLLWSVWVRPRVHPQFALSFAAVRHELRRTGGSQPPRPGAAPCPALSASLAVFAWSILPDGTWATPFGQFQPGFLSATVALRVAEDSWARLAWAADAETTQALAAHEHVALSFHHRTVLMPATGTMRRALHAAAHDTRTLQRMELPFAACTCGDPLPTRTHVTFDCPDDVFPGQRRSTAEHRLLVPVVSGLSSPTWHLPEVSEDLLLGLSQAQTVGHAFLVATDGSALQAPAVRDLMWFQHAGWGIATSEVSGFFGVVPGLGRSSAAAERYALLVLANAAHILGVPVCVLTDNSALVDGFNTSGPHVDFGAFWAMIHALLLDGSSVHWVPAHGRHEEWTSRVPHIPHH